MTKARDLANIISGSGTLNANVIPALPTSKITSGTFDDARLSSSSITQHVDLTSLSASNLTSGTVPSARLSLSASDVPNLAASKITSGTFADARLSSSSVTQHVTAISQTTGSWTPTASGSVTNGFSSATGRYFKIGKLVYVVGNWQIPHGSNGGNQASQGLGYNVNAQFKITGLPFTAANTSFAIVSVGGSHCAVNAQKNGGYHHAVVYHNTSEIQFFCNRVPYNSSYNQDGNQGGPNTGNVGTTGNYHIMHNDDEEKNGGCSFVYYTD